MDSRIFGRKSDWEFHSPVEITFSILRTEVDISLFREITYSSHNEEITGIFNILSRNITNTPNNTSEFKFLSRLVTNMIDRFNSLILSTRNDFYPESEITFLETARRMEERSSFDGRVD